MKINFWGVRGSIPSPGKDTVKYGGNTSCVEVVVHDDYSMVFDAGSGIRELGKHYLDNKIKKGKFVKMSLFVTHTHWDHIQGWPFFIPGFVPTSDITIVGASKVDAKLEDVLKGQQQYQYFPVALGEMKGKPSFCEIEEDQPIYVMGQEDSDGKLGIWYIFNPKDYNDFIPNKVFEIKVTGRKLNHPFPGVFAYRMDCSGRSIVMATDTEHYSALDAKLVGLSKGADVLIYDSQYSQEQYDTGAFEGWGHSTVDKGIELAVAAGVKTLITFHYDPNSTDSMLDDMIEKAFEKGKKVGVEVIAACEGTSINVNTDVPENVGINNK